MQAEINLHDKEAVDAEDRKRFAFVNKIVSEVEQREVHTNERNKQDKIDAVITNKFVGIVIFAVVMWAVFWVSQSKVGPWIADWLVGWIETFQGYVSGLLDGGSPAAAGDPGRRYRRWCWRRSRFPAAGNGNVLPDRTSGRLRIYGACQRCYGPDLQACWSVR